MLNALKFKLLLLNVIILLSFSSFSNALVLYATGGTTNHSALSNLASDDHPQYLNNSRAYLLFYWRNETNSTSEIGTRISGFENASNKGVAGGYVPLNSSGKIDVSNLTGVELLANKGTASGYCPLNASGKIDASYISGFSLETHGHTAYLTNSSLGLANYAASLNATGVIPNAQIHGGITRNTQLVDYLTNSSKGIAGGVVPLNASGKIDLSNLTGVELLANKNASMGYPNLTADRFIPASQLGTGTNSSTTYLRGDLSWTSIGSGSPHTILDGSTHTDSAAGTVSRGDIITGQSATPKWTRLAKGSANQVLAMDASGTDVSWTTPNGNTAQSLTSLLAAKRWWRIQQNDGLTTLFNDGFTTAPQAAGTATYFPTLVNQYINYTTTAAANRSGWNSTAYTIFQTRHAPIFTAVITTGNLLNSSLFIGFTNFTMQSTSTVTGMAIMFSYNSSTDTNFWRTWVTNGSAYNTRNATTIAINNNTRYVLTINASNQQNITFYVNNVLADYQTYGTLPNSTNLGYTVMKQNQTATDVTWGISNIFMEYG